MFSCCQSMTLNDRSRGAAAETLTDCGFHKLLKVHLLHMAAHSPLSVAGSSVATRHDHTAVKAFKRLKPHICQKREMTCSLWRNQISQSLLLFSYCSFFSFFFSLSLFLLGDVPAWLGMSGADQSSDQWPQSSSCRQRTQVCHIFGDTCAQKMYIGKSEVSPQLWPSSQIKRLAPPIKRRVQRKGELIISTATLSARSEQKTHWATTPQFPKVEGGGDRKRSGVLKWFCSFDFSC